MVESKFDVFTVSKREFKGTVGILNLYVVIDVIY